MKWFKNKCKQVVKAVAGFAMRLVKHTVKAVKEIAEAAVEGVSAAISGVNWKRAVTLATVVAALLVSGASAFADTTFADPSTITTTATTVFTAVATLMVGIVGFWVVLKIVRKISGK